MATDSFPAIRFLAGLAFQSIHYAILDAQPETNSAHEPDDVAQFVS